MRASLLALLVLAPVAAFGRDAGQWGDVDPATRDWFARQRNQLGQVCCDIADGRPADDWRRTPTGYAVTVDGVEVEVAPGARVDGVNRMGVPLAWVYPPGSPVTKETLRCFMPGQEG